MTPTGSITISSRFRPPTTNSPTTMTTAASSRERGGGPRCGFLRIYCIARTEFASVGETPLDAGIGKRIAWSVHAPPATRRSMHGRGRPGARPRAGARGPSQSPDGPNASAPDGIYPLRLLVPLRVRVAPQRERSSRFGYHAATPRSGPPGDQPGGRCSSAIAGAPVAGGARAARPTTVPA